MSGIPAHVRWAAAAAPGALPEPKPSLADALSQGLEATSTESASGHARQKPKRRRRRDYRSPSMPPTEPASGSLPPSGEPAVITEVMVKLERVRRDLGDLRSTLQDLMIDRSPSHCAACAQALTPKATRYLRATLTASIDSLEVDERYFEQRLAQLSGQRSADPLEGIGFIDDDDGTLPF